MKSVSFQKVSVRFGDFLALNDVSFTANSGEIFGLMGPNGSGKSTALKVMCGLIRPLSGSVLLDGRPVKVREKQFRKIIGYCPQEDSFFEKLTVGENMKYFAKLYNVKGDLERLVGGITASLGIDDKTDELAARLSGGMKRRLNIACALLHEPEILLMDEPSIELDPISRNELWKMIKLINRSGTTIIISSNLMEEIRFLSSRTVFLQNGAKLYEGRTGEVMEYLSRGGYGLLR